MISLMFIPQTPFGWRERGGLWAPYPPNPSEGVGLCKKGDGGAWWAGQSDWQREEQTGTGICCHVTTWQSYPATKRFVPSYPPHICHQVFAQCLPAINLYHRYFATSLPTYPPTYPSGPIHVGQIPIEVFPGIRLLLRRENLRFASHWKGSQSPRVYANSAHLHLVTQMSGFHLHESKTVGHSTGISHWTNISIGGSKKKAFTKKWKCRIVQLNMKSIEEHIRYL